MNTIKKIMRRAGQAKRKATGLSALAYLLQPASKNAREGRAQTNASIPARTALVPAQSTSILKTIFITSVLFLTTSFVLNPKIKFPYEQAGLTNRQAAAHLLSRFTFGAKPGEVDLVLKTGIENWVNQQLKGNLDDENLKEKLSSYDALSLSNEQILAQFPRGVEVRRMAIRDGAISKDSITDINKKELKQQYEAYRKQKGLRDEKELFRQLINQKIIRATYSNNQLHEVLTDFWFNHFNVSITKNQCAQFIPVYERDAIRPYVIAKFQDMLLATAKSPAMLMYLDNFLSMDTHKEFEIQGNRNGKRKIKPQHVKLANKKKAQGLNENYAREVMELHTLGVDGGYTQTDVTEAARVLTGWTIYPMKEDGVFATIRKILDKVGEKNLAKKGFVHDGDFLFAINRHDSKEKNVLGKKFKAGGGYQEGVDLLSAFAHHASTSKFISKKLAIRFVSDTPPQSLLDKMAKTFLDTDGNISEVLLTMISSIEFWNAESLRAKTKSPFEYAISSVRALDADIEFPFQVNQWITKMGQKLYFYSAPTGFPDRGQYWINTGALLTRMNFGLALAAKKIPGVSFDLASLNDHHESESAQAALITYSHLMMPERNVETTISRLTPLINKPGIDKNINDVANQRNNSNEMEPDEMVMEEKKTNHSEPKIKNSFGDNTMLAQVVGIIIGSPEFQRR